MIFYVKRDKKIRLEKINLELQKYEELKKEMKEIEDSLMDCKNTILGLEKKKFSFLDRYLLKRELFEETGLKIREKRELYNQLLLRLKVVEEKIETMSEYGNEVSSINREKTLSDLRLSFDDAIKLLEKHGVEFVLNESDKEITLNDSSFMNDVILFYFIKHCKDLLEIVLLVYGMQMLMIVFLIL